MRHASQRRALLHRQGVLSEQRTSYARVGVCDAAGISAASSAVAGRARQARSAPLRESRCVMWHASQRRALPLQAKRDKRDARPYARVGRASGTLRESRCVMRQASQQRALLHSRQGVLSEQRTSYARVGV
eukprot:scaffold12202_cov61-Phaeocystis_antarctica.AAC.3